MSAHQFTFPPPPPAPPTTTQNYPAYSQPGAGQNYQGGRGNRGDRGYRGYGRGNGRGGQRGGGNVGSAYANSSYSGYPSAGGGASVPPKGSYNVQVNGHRGGYPLPSYPQVQLPQYPTNVAQEYGQRPPNFGPSATYPQPSQAAYPSDSQGPSQQMSGQNRYGSHGYGSPAPNTQPDPYAPQNPEPFLPRHGAGHTQPVLMGPPLRLGFDKQGKDLQIQQHLQQNTANPYQNGTYNGSVSPLRHDFPLSNHTARHQSLNPFPSHRGQGQKRRHEDAFNRPRNPNPRPQAAPAVPSFGAPLPLPVKPPAPQEGPKNPRKKKKRKHNQLGLTPKTEEHESSEEEVEDDADEEARLAVAVNRGPQLLQFEYRGRTSTLQSSSDITAWIEERKKRFPTKARAAETAERKRQHQEAQRAANLKRKEAQEKQRIEREENLKTKREEEQMRKQKKFEDNCEDAATKAKRKVEKLRKQLEREERRAAKAEAKASKNKLQGKAKGHYEMGSGESHERMRPNSDGSHDQKSAEAQVTKPGEALPTNAVTETPVQAEPFLDSKQKANETVNQTSALTTLREKEEAVFPIPDPLTPTSQPAAPDDQSEPAPSAFELDIEKPVTSLSNDPDRLEGDVSAIISIEKASQSSSITMSDSSSQISSTESEDATSSSGSTSSDADSDSPDQASSRRDGPERILPPPRRKPKLICRDFLKNGRCKRGDNCRFRHELPERGSHEARVVEVPKVDKRTARIGLHQRLVEQEKEKEDHEILRAIIHLGERGLLNQGAPSEGLER